MPEICGKLFMHRGVARMGFWWSNLMDLIACSYAITLECMVGFVDVDNDKGGYREKNTGH